MSDLTYYAIGDVHGEIEKLHELFRLIREDALLRKAPQQIVFLGDLIDRGPDSRDVVHAVMKLADAGLAVCLKGNHEEMLLNAIDSTSRNTFATWNLNGGDTALESYERANGKGGDWRESVDLAHVKWLRTLPSIIRDEARNLVFVHAGIDPWRFPDCPEGVRLWTRSKEFFDSERWPEREETRDILIVHGHTPTDDFEPDVAPRRINVDTGACFGGPLTAVVLAPGEAPRFLRA
jgi:serine/threonine protein phosphatase 1